jgi:hypothetical protein
MAMPSIILLEEHCYRDRLYIVPAHRTIDFFPPPSREWIESEIQFNMKNIKHVILCNKLSAGGYVENPIKIVCEGEADRPNQ